MKVDLRKGRSPARRSFAPVWSRFNTNATTLISRAAPFACVATSSRFSRPTSAKRPCASNGAATKSRLFPIIDPLRGKILRKLEEVSIFPGSHYVTPSDQLVRAMTGIKEELRERLTELHAGNRLVEEQRLSQRTLYDLEMIEQMGRCKGIENYSPPVGPQGRASRRPRLSTIFPRTFCSGRRVPP